MILKKKVSLGVGFARKKAYEYQGTKYEADLKDGDIITMLDGGKTVPGQFGEQNVFNIQTRNGEKALAFNQVSQNNLIEAFGENTDSWVNKKVKVWTIKAMVGGKMQTILYLSHPDWEMDDEGKFSANGSPVEADDEGVDEIIWDDQPEAAK